MPVFMKTDAYAIVNCFLNKINPSKDQEVKITTRPHKSLHKSITGILHFPIPVIDNAKYSKIFPRLHGFKFKFNL